MNAETTEAATTKAPGVPRAPSPENQARLDYIVQRAASEPGVTSPAIAKELGIGTLTCSQLADRLVRKGEIQLLKVAGGVRTYYPAGYDMASIPAPAAPEAPKEKKSKKAEAAAPSEE